MNPITYAELRRHDLLVEADQARLARIASLARRCAEQCCPSLFRRLLAAIPARRSAPLAC